MLNSSVFLGVLGLLSPFPSLTESYKSSYEHEVFGTVFGTSLVIQGDYLQYRQLWICRGVCQQIQSGHGEHHDDGYCPSHHVELMEKTHVMSCCDFNMCGGGGGGNS